MVNLLGTIFCSGLIHIWCHSEFSRWRDDECALLKANAQCFHNEPYNIKVFGRDALYILGQYWNM